MIEPQTELKKIAAILDAWEPIGCADHNYHLAKESWRSLDTHNQLQPISSYGAGRLVLLGEALDRLDQAKGSFEDQLSSARHYVSQLTGIYGSAHE